MMREPGGRQPRRGRAARSGGSAGTFWSWNSVPGGGWNPALLRVSPGGRLARRPEAEPGRSGGAGTGGGPAHVGAGGGPRGARGGRVWFPRLPGGICMCVWQPQTSCSFDAAGTRRPGRRAGGRRARQERAPPHPDATAGSRPRRAAFRSGATSPPGRAERPAPRRGRAPARPRGHLRPRRRAPPPGPPRGPKP